MTKEVLKKHDSFLKTQQIIVYTVLAITMIVTIIEGIISKNIDFSKHAMLTTGAMMTKEPPIMTWFTCIFTHVSFIHALTNLILFYMITKIAFQQKKNLYLIPCLVWTTLSNAVEWFSKSSQITGGLSGLIIAIATIFIIEDWINGNLSIFTVALIFIVISSLFTTTGIDVYSHATGVIGGALILFTERKLVKKNV